MNTKNITDKAERKKVKRAARKKAAPKPKRASGVARGSMKKKIKKSNNDASGATGGIPTFGSVSGEGKVI